MSWYNPGSMNPFTGLMNGSDSPASADNISDWTIGHAVNGSGIFHNVPHVGPDGFDSSTVGGQVQAQDAEPQPTLSQYLNDNPDASYEDAMKYMAQHSEEWAEKYLDYLTEKGELAAANEYTSQREDTAYQRLVQDLKSAGLNPALMYGSSASISASGSQGYVKMSEGANTRSVSNYKKIQEVFMAYMMYQLKAILGVANIGTKLMSNFTSLL